MSQSRRRHTLPHLTLRSLLGKEDPEALKAKSSKLIADLPSLLPEDPALAAVIAEAMAAEFGAAASGPVAFAPADAVHSWKKGE